MFNRRVNETVDMIVRHRGARMEPAKFRWQDRVYRVRAVNGQWQEKEGEYKKYFFAVDCGSEEVYELYLHTRDMTWRLGTIASLGNTYPG